MLRPFDIVAFDSSATNQRNSHRLKIAGSHRPEGGIPLVGLYAIVTAFHPNGVAETTSIEWKTRGC
jgi:hypothetical protein